jgi:hypothetical protein
VKERLTFEKTAVGFYLSGHLFDEVALEVRRFVRTKVDDLVDSRDQLLLAGIITDFRVINGQRGKLALFKLDDKSGTIEATADEGVINAHRNLLKDDELVIVQAKLQPDRFTGGFRLSVQLAWDLATARCRFGKFLRVAVNGKAPDIQRLVREFPARREQTEQGDVVRGLPVRLACGARRPWPNCNWAKRPLLPHRRRAGQLDGASRPGIGADRLRIGSGRGGHAGRQMLRAPFGTFVLPASAFNPAAGTPAPPTEARARRRRAGTSPCGPGRAARRRPRS